MVLREKRPVWPVGVGVGWGLQHPLPLEFLGEKRNTQAFGVGTRQGGLGGGSGVWSRSRSWSWDFNSLSASTAGTAARSCLRDWAASCAVNYTPPMGLLGSGALMCGKAF